MVMNVYRTNCWKVTVECHARRMTTQFIMQMVVDVIAEAHKV